MVTVVYAKLGTN